MDDPGIIDFLESTHAFPPDVALVFRPVGPEGLFDLCPLPLVPKADEVIKVAIGHTLYVHENGRALD